MAVSDITKVILRFRDLALSDGDTIARHRDMIDKHGSTWWGWWAPRDEQIPDAAMRRLAELTAGEGLEAFLFDSGRRLIFRARCTEVSWNPRHDRILSPNADRTPAYYSDKLCLAWFEFATIDDEDTEAVNALSYVDVPELFVDAAGDYSAFANKRIASLQELHYQRRTMWFVRPPAPSDLEHEILLIGRDVVEPRDFQSSFIVRPERRLLWLSDLHFATGAQHAFPVEMSKDGDRYPLSAALDRETARSGRAEFAGLLVSGDLTWKADPEEFALARQCLHDISTWARLGADVHRIGLIPGNHDLRYSPSPDDPEAEVTLAPADAKAAYVEFYRSVFNRSPNAFMSMGRKYLLGESIPVEIAMLNSSLLEQVPERRDEASGANRPLVRFQGQGFVGESQLQDASQHMNWAEVRARRTIRIVMLHHHLIPVSYSEPAAFGANYSTVLDAGRLARWLVDNRVDIVLHGHQHEPFVSRVSRPIDPSDSSAGWHSFYVLGMGSSGVASAHRPSDVPNVFAELEFTDYSVHLVISSIDQTLRSQPRSRVTLDLAPT